MSKVERKNVEDRLRRVIDRDSGKDVVSAGIISGIVVRDHKVGFVITIDAKDKERKAWLREACEAEVANMPGVESVTAVMAAERQAPARAQAPETRKPVVWNTTPLEHVKRVVAIASGKGGVGKSTLTVNLAQALIRQGQHVGILDADIYGPSIPRMLALSGQPHIAESHMLPLIAHGIKCMSMGFITGEQAAILRGPMISKTLHQLLRSTRWGSEAEPLDTLLVDMPPGTGDIHLSMAQQVPLTGVIIVTTPQQVAVIDARKALHMFVKLGVPVLGVIENMSGGLFGSGGGKMLAEEAGVPFLGEIALDAAIVEASDSGILYQGTEVMHYQAVAEKLFQAMQ